MNILCICPIGIGNYVLFYPACAMLKKQMPDAKLHLLALRGSIGGMAEHDPLWNGITVFDPTKIKGDFVRQYAIIRELRDHHFDSSLSFFPSNTWQYNLLPWLCGIENRWGFLYHLKRNTSLSFLNTDLIAVDPARHDLEQNIWMVAQFTFSELWNEEICYPTLFTEANQQTAQAYWKSVTTNKNRIGIHPGSSADHGMDIKRWDPLRFAELADLAGEYLDAEVFVFGSPDENDIKTRVARSTKRPCHIVPPMTIGETAALLAGCSLCICNDSGLMHIAASQNVPTVGIFGPTDERRNGPRGKKTLCVRSKMPGFPLWTSQNVGRRETPKGIDPRASLNALTAKDAWILIKAWIETEM